MRPERTESPNRGPNGSAQCAKHKFPIVHKQSNQASKLTTSQAIPPPSWRILGQGRRDCSGCPRHRDCARNRLWNRLGRGWCYFLESWCWFLKEFAWVVLDHSNSKHAMVRGGIAASINPLFTPAPCSNEPLSCNKRSVARAGNPSANPSSRIFNGAVSLN